jgi:AraC-like DNA-binding protein
MDVLSDVLETVRSKDLRIARAELSAPWGFKVGDTDGQAALYVVTGGAGWLEAEGLEHPLRLDTGDMVLLPRGPAHVLRDDPSSTANPLESLGSLPAEGSHLAVGPTTALVAGRFQLEDRATHPLLSVLPSVLHVKGVEGRPARWLEALLGLLTEELGADRPAGRMVIGRLSDLLFVEAVRAHLATLAGDQAAAGWLKALVDPQIGPALARVHEKPEAPWTVASLAHEVAMSRSAFAARFTQLVGESPLQYVTRWRMQKAAELLRTGRATLVEIADLVGYESEAAFSKAYKRWVGASPGAYRRAAQASARAARPRVPAKLGRSVTAGLALD